MQQSNLSKLLATFVSLRPRLLARAQSRLGSRALAEDLMQDTWLKVETARPDTTVENPAGFIVQVANNVICDHFRKERRRAEIDAEVRDLIWESADDLSAERSLIGRDNLRAARAALEALPEKTRQIFLLNRIQNVPHRRIAEMFDMSDQAVYYHVRRALEHLAQIRDDMRDG